MDSVEGNANAISALNGEFQDHLRARGLTGRIALRELATTEFMRNYEFEINSWPFFISPGFIGQLEQMNASLPRLIYKALRGLFADDPLQMAQALQLDPVLCSVFFSGVPLADICFRSDAILTQAGLRVLEMNLGTAIGGWQLQWMEEVFRGYPGYRAFFDSHPFSMRNTPVIFFRFLIESARRISAPGSLYILLKIKQSTQIADYGGFLERYIQQAMRESGQHCEVGFFRSFDELQISADGVFHDGRRVRLVTFGELGREIVPVPLLRCVLAGKLACPDFPTYMLLSDKRNLALLHLAGQRGVLAQQEVALVEKFVPKTHILGGALSSPSLYGELMAQKDRFVLKPSSGMQGIDVHVGRFLSQADWQAGIARIERPELWIAQEYCESQKFYAQGGTDRESFDFVWGVFQFGERYGGCWIRMMPHTGGYDGIINSARGAQESIVFEAAR